MGALGLGPQGPRPGEYTGGNGSKRKRAFDMKTHEGEGGGKGVGHLTSLCTRQEVPKEAADMCIFRFWERRIEGPVVHGTQPMNSTLTRPARGVLARLD